MEPTLVFGKLPLPRPGCEMNRDLGESDRNNTLDLPVKFSKKYINIKQILFTVGAESHEGEQCYSQLIFYSTR